MDMVERVARAIWNIRREEEDRCDMELEDMGRRHSVWEEARAAIEALREPTEAMEKVAVDKFPAYAEDNDSDRVYAIQWYRSIIDAALSTKGGE